MQPLDLNGRRLNGRANEKKNEKKNYEKSEPNVNLINARGSYFVQ